MHVECPKDTKFTIPLGWTTTLNGSDGSVREVVTNRYVNITLVGEDNYLQCCGAIKGQGPAELKGHVRGCYKGEVEEKKARMAEAVAKRPEMIRPPMHVMVARKAYINAVKQRVIPQIKNYMIAITDGEGETRMQPAIPTECKAWSSLAGHKRKTTGQCQPGVYCARNCKLIPCVAIRWGMSEEMEAREAFAAQIMSTDSTR